jgi:GDP-4-dehydro-6-deoxy-D-mannose reductase
MKILVTGADGFVGGWLVRRLLERAHHVVGAVRVGSHPAHLLTESERFRVQWVEFDLLSADSVGGLVEVRPDAVVHLAAVASGADARQDPGYAWTVNAAGTARLAEAFGRQVARGEADPVFLAISTGEVYGQGHGGVHPETDLLAPCSPYAASKVGAEVAALEVARRTRLRTIVARAFPHTGPGQSTKYVVPALAQRMRTAKRIGAPAIKAGNLDPVRDLLDVRDVVAAYDALLERGEPGEVYNVASGVGVPLRDVVDRLAAVLQLRIIVETDPALSRSNDIRHLVGDSSRLRQATGWAPTFSLERTLKDLVDAQTD